MVVGTLASIWRYPTKSLRGDPLEHALATPAGIPGDRAGALFVECGHVREGKTYRGKEHDRLHLATSADEAVALAQSRGVAVTQRRDGPFFDDAPISLLVDRWLDELSALIGYAVEPQRFRPNFFVRAATDFHDGEAALEGAELQLGFARMRVRYPIERCVTTTYDPAGGDADPNILRLVAQRRNNIMGVYCDVIEPGSVKTGDSLVRVSS
ncbi:MAG: MOSC domain-containing protein [Candidatus Eremiobacteraeota bacterium]|nr:MOSC domain-containing protein [Candidatus Eremiobacteraeota bacterium]